LTASNCPIAVIPKSPAKSAGSGKVREDPGHPSRKAGSERFRVSQAGFVLRRTIEVDCDVAIGGAANGLPLLCSKRE
jgi:hypothetical protein